MNTCYYCRGAIEDVTIDYMASRKGEYVLVKDVRAQKCRQCGELYFDYESSRRIDEALEKAPLAEEHLTVPIVRGA